ncbi:MAG TPA: phospholipase A2 family protein [Salinarimonas sp.]|jgi:hypothetical protein|nr:phospholipase A2 family protein [Salinarimonas sp.]
MTRLGLVLAFLAALGGPVLAQTARPPAVVVEEEPEPIPKPLPPDPQALPAPTTGGSATDALAGRVPYHGNYCGRANRGGVPVDALDEVCKRHDECYDNQGDGACACDTLLRTESLAVANDAFQAPEVRRRAAAITAAMEVKSCSR